MQRTVTPFTRAEWDRLVKLPGRVVVAATAAQADSARHTVHEGLAGIDAFAAGRASASRLVREVVAAIYHEPDEDRPVAEEVLDRAAGIAGGLAGRRNAGRLLAEGDRRNVVDRYRYWRREAIVADLDTRRHEFHVAIENWQHDLNIGTVVRNANAFLAAEVHIIGKRKWNRRGAMVTDRYQHVRQHPTIEEFVGWAKAAGLAVVGIDNLPGARLLEQAELPRRCVLLFGQEGPGLSGAARDACDNVVFIAQFGSTRSINAGVASGIAMHAWIRQWGQFPDSLDGGAEGDERN